MTHASMSTRRALRPASCIPWRQLDFDAQIPKKGDQRQMEAWQRIGTYAAGLALESAGVKGNTEILSRMDMIVAAGGGERDLAVDSNILNLEAEGQFGARLSQRTADERSAPDALPGAASNLLAGNIAIVHGVTGSSRTFMGEEASGVDAVRIALARIAAGQSDIALIGGSQNGERKDLLVLYEFGEFNLKDKFAPVWERGATGGFALGSGGAFLVIESESACGKRAAPSRSRASPTSSPTCRAANRPAT